MPMPSPSGNGSFMFARGLACGEGYGLTDNPARSRDMLRECPCPPLHERLCAPTLLGFIGPKPSPPGMPTPKFPKSPTTLSGVKKRWGTSAGDPLIDGDEAPEREVKLFAGG